MTSDVFLHLRGEISKPSSASWWKDLRLLLSCLHCFSRSFKAKPMHIFLIDSFCLLSIEYRHLLGDNGRWSVFTGDNGRWSVFIGDNGRWNIFIGDNGRWSVFIGGSGRWSVFLKFRPCPACSWILILQTHDGFTSFMSPAPRCPFTGPPEQLPAPTWSLSALFLHIM